MTLPLAALLQGAVAGEPTGQTYVDDVFSTYIYTGNGSTQTITNGIDLAGKGGMVWIKSRTSTQDHLLMDTQRGVGNSLTSDSTNGASTSNPTILTAFNGDGFSLGNQVYTNENARPYVSWTFRKAPKFFDVVTYTGNGVAGRQIPHSLGVTPGMIIVKAIDGAAVNWQVYHRGLTYTQRLALNTTDAASASTGIWSAEPDATNIFVGSASGVNANAVNYVAYLFAHDPSADGIIQCGIYTGNGSTQEINLGIEPQFLMVKGASITNSSWLMLDNMRGFPVSGNTARLDANSSGAEFSTTDIAIRNNGFWVNNDTNTNSNGQTYIYLAIRRPNKPPTSGTQVYNAIARTGTGAAATVTGVGFAPDFILGGSRRPDLYGQFGRPVDRLRGASSYLTTSSTSAETTYPNAITSFNMNGVSIGADDSSSFNYSGNGVIHHFFRRAPGFFDVVCYTGNGGPSLVVPHGLGVLPEMAIFKVRNSADSWYVFLPNVFGVGKYIRMNLTSSVTTDANQLAGISSTTITLPNGYQLNGGGGTYVAYLFATLPGISKVGSYTGNGTSQTINAGFTTGARFVLIKRTDNTGDWYVWDSTRGIVAGNDPHLSLNTTAAEVTTDDSIDPDNSGFIVNQLAATNINVTSATYIYLAFA